MILRRALKHMAASMLRATGVDRLIHRLADGSYAPVVLGYHRVVDDFAAHAAVTIRPMLTSRQMLECHLRWLSEHFQFISLDEVGDHYESGRQFDRPVVAVTFDDGYRDVYDHGLPILRRYGVPGAVFVVTDFIEHQSPLGHDRLYMIVRHALTTARGRLLLASLRSIVGLSQSADDEEEAYRFTTALLGNMPGATVRAVTRQLETVVGVTQCVATAPPLTWPMLAEMRDLGWTIGLHTAGHSVLARETPDVIDSEVVQSKQMLERRLGRPARHFAYPDGRFNRAVLRALTAAGIPLAYTTCRHRDPEFPALTIPRRLLWERSSVGPRGRFSPGIMSGHVCGLFEYFTPCAENHLAGSAPSATRVTGGAASHAIARGH